MSEYGTRTTAAAEIDDLIADAAGSYIRLAARFDNSPDYWIEIAYFGLINRLTNVLFNAVLSETNTL